MTFHTFELPCGHLFIMKYTLWGANRIIVKPKSRIVSIIFGNSVYCSQCVEEKLNGGIVPLCEAGMMPSYKEINA